ncbi:uncharacterized protein LOC112553237 [Pomacea canaliculata]|uniref:uncharacterized protein LOC112553237 n=1 Tax=Pomacea canaliculata TaxID=400727 RepID=UPI000D73DEF7|nr:uncharacterized protein LOC112553237 [Pomacea canaliculata]
MNHIRREVPSCSCDFPLARGENVTGVAKACIRAKTSDLGGRFAGIARKVYSFGYPPSPDEGCAVFHFPSLKNAEVFFHSDQRFRQPDFPPPQGHSEIFALGLTTDPNQVYNYATFLLSEVFLHGSTTVGDYITKFKEPFSSLLIHKYKALPFVAFSLDKDDRKSLRRHYFAPKSIVTLHLFRSIGHLEEVMSDERYTQLRVIHNSIAQERCCIFTIDSEACP